QLLLPASSGCFVTRRLAPPAWIYDQVHSGGSEATEGSGGVEQLSTTPPDASLLAGSFLQHGFMTTPDCGSSLQCQLWRGG
ncbi:MAG: hypothetical protein FWF18_04730, partial [Dehalococcoidia bacterium]|nr:hypothetical protein [Dehalococcoidia bacterium]